MVLSSTRPSVRATLTIVLVLTLAGCAAQSTGRTATATQRASVPPAVRAERTARVHSPAPPAPLPAKPPSELRDDDGPLSAKIKDDTPAARAAALRRTEQARGMLAAGEEARAIELLERAIAIDARTPYAHYFLAEAHYAAGRPTLARPFLDRAAQLLSGEPYWLARVHALRGRMLEEEGRSADARAAYERALAVWPRNSVAAAGLARVGTAP
jgi:Tfp pilus assembly protein PilF